MADKQMSSENKTALMWTAGILVIAVIAGLVVVMFAS